MSFKWEFVCFLLIRFRLNIFGKNTTMHCKTYTGVPNALIKLSHEGVPKELVKSEEEELVKSLAL